MDLPVDGMSHGSAAAAIEPRSVAHEYTLN
jgi:hypothetical protein